MISGDKLKLARRMRREPTSAERLLWGLLRGHKLEGMKFRRQVPMGRYVADFVCEAHRLIVEADGPFHDEAADAIRDGWFAAKGYKVLHFPVSLVHNRPELVMEDICLAASQRPQAPNFR